MSKKTTKKKTSLPKNWENRDSSDEWQRIIPITPPTHIINLHKINNRRPYCDIYIGRSVKNTEFITDSKWANPFRVDDNNKDSVLAQYETYIRAKIKNDPITYNIEELRGKILGCWCTNTTKTKPLVCHGQILLKILNEVK